MLGRDNERDPQPLSQVQRSRRVLHMEIRLPSARHGQDTARERNRRRRRRFLHASNARRRVFTVGHLILQR